MTQELAAPPSPSRSPWQSLYGFVHRRRRKRAARSAEHLPVPVVSVGNLLWGGAGKTPLVLALARHLRDRGIAVTVLSRGYKRTTEGPLIVSRGEGPLVSVDAAGDEAFLAARELQGVGVVVAERRVEGGRLALAELRPAPRLFLLDDGFSHVALARDLDLLLFPAADPWGGGRLAPAGRLREPLACAAFADAAILTGAERVAIPPRNAGRSAPGETLARALARYGFVGEGFASAVATELALFAPGRPVPPESRIVAVAGIARPERFFAALRRHGFRVESELTFPDHHDYPPKSLGRIDDAVTDHGASAVITTAKDRVKLEGRIAAPLAHLPIQAVPEPAFWRFLDDRVDRLLR